MEGVDNFWHQMLNFKSPNTQLMNTKTIPVANVNIDLGIWFEEHDFTKVNFGTKKMQILLLKD